jgi:methionyl-tRNA formyltransferase
VGRIGRIVFLGTGSFGVPLLRRLPDLADGLLVVTAPDRPAGRGLQPRASPVAAEARSLGVSLATPRRLRSDEGRAAIRDFAPDGLLLAAYGQLVPADLLGLAPRPPLNVHPSLLPRHRGAAPVAAAILAGDELTGVSLMVMTPELDAGPIVAQWAVPLTGRERAPELEARLAALAADEVPPVLEAWAGEGVEAHPQDSRLATVVGGFTREDGRIDWSKPADAIDRQVRALQPWPGAWTTLGEHRLHVRRAHPDQAGAEDREDRIPGAVLPGSPVRVATGRGVLVLDEVQPAGRPTMAADAWRRGLPQPNLRLGE